MALEETARSGRASSSGWAGVVQRDAKLPTGRGRLAAPSFRVFPRSINIWTNSGMSRVRWCSEGYQNGLLLFPFGLQGCGYKGIMVFHFSALHVGRVLGVVFPLSMLHTCVDHASEGMTQCLLGGDHSFLNGLKRGNMHMPLCLAGYLVM